VLVCASGWLLLPLGLFRPARTNTRAGIRVSVREGTKEAEQRSAAEGARRKNCGGRIKALSLSVSTSSVFLSLPLALPLPPPLLLVLVLPGVGKQTRGLARATLSQAEERAPSAHGGARVAVRAAPRHRHQATSSFTADISRRLSLAPPAR